MRNIWHGLTSHPSAEGSTPVAELLGQFSLSVGGNEQPEYPTTIRSVVTCSDQPRYDYAKVLEYARRMGLRLDFPL